MGSIAIVGVGQGDSFALPDAVVSLMREADAVVVPAEESPAADAVRGVGLDPVTYASLGVRPEAPSADIVDALEALAAERRVVLAVAGYPFLKGGVITGLLARSGGPVEVFPGPSALDALVLAFDVDLTADLDIVDASAMRTAQLERGSHLIVTGVRTRLAARRVAEALHDVLPPEHPAVVAETGSAGGFTVRPTTVGALAELAPSAEVSVYVPPTHELEPGRFDELVRVIAVLRGPGGCPWDREQTHMTLRQNLIEEAYETVAAIEEGDDAHLCEELGDVLLQIVLHAQMAAEAGTFTIDDAVSGIVAKLRRRHPHIFGGESAGTAAEVIAKWDRIKAAEQEDRGQRILGGVPEALPSLMFAQKVSRKAAAAGFDWVTVEDVWDKLHEELAELRAATPKTPEVEDEIGDVLFTVVNLARRLGIDSETALRGATHKFIRRFESMEDAAEARGGLAGMPLDGMESLWQRVKAREKE